jgi:hypothetical protein
MKTPLRPVRLASIFVRPFVLAGIFLFLLWFGFTAMDDPGLKDSMVWYVLAGSAGVTAFVAKMWKSK